MWSPKTKKDGSKNQFYENMTRVSPGDILFSYYNGGIGHLGRITSKAFSGIEPTQNSGEPKTGVGGGTNWQGMLF